MTGHNDNELDPTAEAQGDAPRLDSEDSDSAVSLLQRALANPPHRDKSSLPKIQDRIRANTRGRYFKDRWSRLSDPFPLMLVIALFFLCLSAMFYLVLQPLVDAPQNVELPSAPVDPLAVDE